MSLISYNFHQVRDCLARSPISIAQQDNSNLINSVQLKKINSIQLNAILLLFVYQNSESVA